MVTRGSSYSWPWGPRKSSRPRDRWECLVQRREKIRGLSGGGGVEGPMVRGMCTSHPAPHVTMNVARAWHVAYGACHAVSTKTVRVTKLHPDLTYRKAALQARSEVRKKVETFVFRRGATMEEVVEGPGKGGPELQQPSRVGSAGISGFRGGRRGRLSSLWCMCDLGSSTKTTKSEGGAGGGVAQTQEDTPRTWASECRGKLVLYYQIR